MNINNRIIVYESIKEKANNGKVAICGAGLFGKRLAYRIAEENDCCHFIMCDNDENKWNTEYKGIRVKPVEDVVNDKNVSIFLFIINRATNDAHALGMYEQISNRIESNRIFFLYSDTISICSDEEINKNSVDYIERILSKQYFYKKTNKESIVCLANTRTAKRNGGGPGKVLVTLEKVFGYFWNGISITYRHSVDNDISYSGKYIGILANVEYGVIQGKNEKAVYIVHNILEAAGLAYLGRKYAIVYHAQGELTYEITKFGYSIDDILKEKIKEVELYAIKNASYVCFPSIGAEKFFWKTYDIDRIPNYNHFEPLYNTVLTDDLQMQTRVEGIEKDKTRLTFLSVGQMTTMKGIDRIPNFLEEFSKEYGKKIRWIAVANGPLKERVARDIGKNRAMIDYYQFDGLCHDQINYLMEVADVYIMLHRVSIFDLATLEAMYFNKHIILSRIPGNEEFNIDDNIILINENAQIDYRAIIRRIVDTLSQNRRVFDLYFSPENFKKRYERLFMAMLEG